MVGEKSKRHRRVMMRDALRWAAWILNQSAKIGRLILQKDDHPVGVIQTMVSGRSFFWFF